MSTFTVLNQLGLFAPALPKCRKHHGHMCFTEDLRWGTLIAEHTVGTSKPKGILPVFEPESRTCV